MVLRFMQLYGCANCGGVWVLPPHGAYRCPRCLNVAVELMDYEQEEIDEDEYAI